MISDPPIAVLLAEASRLDSTVHAARELQLRPLGLSVAQARVLSRVGLGPLTVAALARRLGLTRQSVQRIADLLVSQGIAEHRDNPDHKRAKLLAATSLGQERLEALRLAEESWLSGLRSELTEQTTDPQHDINPAIELMRLVRETIESRSSHSERG